MDDQQAIKNWFVGFLEGEGNFQSPRPGHPCAVRISNVETDLIQFCKEFLSSNQILSSVYPIKRYKHHWSEAEELYIRGQDCSILHHLIKDSMECRIEEFNRILSASTITRETSSNLDWLAGLSEAEGHFTIKTQWWKGNVSYRPEVNITNTNHLILAKIVRTLYNNGLSWYVQDRTPENPRYKSSQQICVVGFKRVKRFLVKLSGKWVGRKTQRKVRLLTEFCDSRLSKVQREPYSNREHQLALEVKMKI